VKRILVAGIGSVLLGDDGIGPYVVRSLEANYVFDEGIEIEDLGTPALDLIDHIAGLDALIVVDAVENGAAPGTVTLYRKPELTRQAPAVRLDPHSPALCDALWAAEFYGSSPQEVLLVGVSAGSLDGGCELSEAVRASVDRVIHEVLRDIDRLEAGFVRRFDEAETEIWWEEPSLQLVG
jgi:hydrogenase maturation protease